ncbi:lipoate--protein ligase [Enterococcus hirae]|uniref:lipoate--protein ligase n=1 Tax=Enterococcus TaxID=1350 RepID=UPI0019F973E6|nr:lipoate--protein ligase [Enterococcus hirae]EMF0272818.1 lipoate--protein ligase [Enterococcus hirae]EMF0389649.1 lipoate--protein ligase [Enterococcus hirae]EMF0390947.1 lipoate--protein ligase [Enterococcus hirae]
MRYHIMESLDIRRNLATEEYLMNSFDSDEPLFLLYIQKPCVIIGRNQNSYEEIDLKYLREKNVTLTRRTSGGGAVYDDLGNLSFSFVTSKNAMKFGEYESITSPIITALRKMGATKAEVGGRNDMYIEGMKFSGNAMYTKKNRLYSHGTLMYDVDLSVLDKILTVSKEKIESKATKSVKKSVTNLKPFLKEKYQFEKTADFRDALICEVYQVDDLQEIEDKRVDLTKKDEQNIEQIVQNRYANDDWVYGETPRFSVKRRIRLPKVGIVDVRLSTLHGRINEIRFYGDFFGQKDVSILEQQLLGQKFIYEEIKNALNNMTVSDYIFHFNNEDLLALLF